MRKMLMLKDGSALVTKESRAFEVERGDESSPIVAVVSDEQPDIVNDVIHTAGWDLEHFNRSPLVLWQHDRSSPNLAAPGTRAYVDGPVLKLEAVHDMGDGMAAFLDGKIRRGVIKETSVGFRSVEWKEMENGVEFFKQSLIEVSWVNRGMNPRTDVLAKTMLGMRPEFVAQLEDAGDPEVIELKAELEEFRGRVVTIENLIARIGEKLAAPEIEKKADAMAEWDAAAAHILGRMKTIGTAS